MVLASTPGVAGKQFVWLWRERVDPEKAMALRVRVS